MATMQRDNAAATSNDNLVVSQQRQIQNNQIEDNLGITLKKPKFPQYAVVSKRVESFKTWPEYLPLKPEVLVDAGLVYTGVGDSVRCYHCGGGLRSWDAGDDPWIEHAKWYPFCPHVQLVKGQKFVEIVGRGGIPQTDCAIETEEKPRIPSLLELLLDVPATSCMQMGFEEQLVKRAIQTFIDRHDHCKFTGRDLCEVIFEIEESGEPMPSESACSSQLPEPQTTVVDEPCNTDNCEPFKDVPTVDEEEVEEDPEEMQKLFEENERLKSNKACKICLDSEANVIFLPCGHMVSCPQCAPALLKCPICRNSVKGYVKAFFAV